MEIKRDPDMSIIAFNVFPYVGYCVYAWRRGAEYLYIGSSSRGIGRLLSAHHVIDKAEKVRDSDVFEFWWFDIGQPDEHNVWPRAPIDQWLTFESSMIQRHKPKYNVTDNPNRRPRLSRRRLAQKEEERVIAERRRRHEEEEWGNKGSWD